MLGKTRQDLSGLLLRSEKGSGGFRLFLVLLGLAVGVFGFQNYLGSSVSPVQSYAVFMVAVFIIVVALLAD